MTIVQPPNIAMTFGSRTIVSVKVSEMGIVCSSCNKTQLNMAVATAAKTPKN